jgi:hypothetical protein
VTRTITTDAERADLMLRVGEQADPAVIRTTNRRIWILVEDDRGDVYGWSWWEDGEERGQQDRWVLHEDMALPWEVIYEPPLPASYDINAAAATS